MLKNKKFTIYLSLICFLSLNLVAQERILLKQESPSAVSYKMIADSGSVTFPFELINNHIVISTKINGITLRLVLDSGMPLDGAILFGDSTVAQLNLQYIGKVPVQGVGSNPIESDMAMGVTINLPKVELYNQMIIVMPYDSIRNCYFEGKNGIFGHGLFSRFVVSVDYDKMKITLTEPDKFKYSGTGFELPIKVINNRVFLNCEAEMLSGAKVPLELVFDTGNRRPLILNVGSYKDIELPKKYIEFNAVSFKEINTRAGRIKSFKIGDFKFDNVLTSFRIDKDEPAPPWEKQGNLGNEILRRFNLIVDYSNQKLILEPNSHFSEPFEFNMAGFQVIRTENGNFRITRVIPNSPAAKSGLKVNDILIDINGQPAAQYTYDDFNELLINENKEVTFLISDKDKSKKVQFKLKRLI